MHKINALLLAATAVLAADAALEKSQIITMSCSDLGLTECLTENANCVQYSNGPNGCCPVGKDCGATVTGSDPTSTKTETMAPAATTSDDLGVATKVTSIHSAIVTDNDETPADGEIDSETHGIKNNGDGDETKVEKLPVSDVDKADKSTNVVEGGSMEVDDDAVATVGSDSDETDLATSTTLSTSATMATVMPEATEGTAEVSPPPVQAAGAVTTVGWTILAFIGAIGGMVVF